MIPSHFKLSCLPLQLTDTCPRVHFLLIILFASLLTVTQSFGADAGSEVKTRNPASEIEALGGHIFKSPKTGKVIEVKLNGSAKLSDEDLVHVSGYKSLTDLSLEGTTVTGSGLVHLAQLRKLEWLNLWQTNLDDKGLAQLTNLKSLRHLPIGSTRITDAGLDHLKEIEGLLYLGLRDTGVTDDGVAKLITLPALKEINLRNTRVTDKCIASLVRIKTLQKVWLGETKVTAKGRIRLRSTLPQCVIDLTEELSPGHDPKYPVTPLKLPGIPGVTPQTPFRASRRIWIV